MGNSRSVARSPESGPARRHRGER